MKRMLAESRIYLLVTIGIFSASAACLPGCAGERPAAGEDGSAAVEVAAPAAPVAASGLAFVPVMGGLVRAVGDYVVELVARPDGRVEAQVRDAAGQPVAEDAVTVTAEVGGGEAPIPVPLVREGDLFVGTAVGVEGVRPVTVVVEPAGRPEVEVAFPEVTLTPPSVVVEAPMHSGQVTLVGDNRVELAAAPDGQVYVSVTDLAGVPLAPDVVTLHHVTVVTPTGPRVVVLEPRGAIFVGALGVPPPPTFSVHFDLGVGPRVYRRVRFRRFHPLPPTAVVVVPPHFHHPGRGWHKGWGPYRPGPPGPHPGKGWAKGHYRGTPFGPPGHAKGPGRGGPPRGGPPVSIRGPGRGGPPRGGPPGRVGGPGRGGPPGHGHRGGGGGGGGRGRGKGR